MATHSSVLAWRIPGMEEPGGLPSMGSHRVGHDWSDLEAAAAQTKCWWVCTCSVTSVMSNSCDSMDHSLPGSLGHRVFPAKILEWVVMPSSKGSSWCRDGAHISCTVGWYFTAEPPGVFMWVKTLAWTCFLRSTGRAQIWSFWIPLFTDRNKGYLKNTAYRKDGVRKTAKTSLG